MIVQWFLTFSTPWTPKSQKKIPRTPKLSKCTTGGPSNTCIRGFKRIQYFTFVIFADPLDPLNGPRLRSYVIVGQRKVML